MRKLSDEVLTLTAGGAASSLTAANLTNTGGPHAELAVFYNHDNGDSEAGFRIGDDPDTATKAYVPIAVGTSVEVRGYENLTTLKIAALGGVDSTVFVEYFA